MYIGPKLSETMRHGLTLRPRSYQERFCHVENRGLCSDPWGAACEAVQPGVALFNWSADPWKFEVAMDAFRAVQHHYFDAYFHMPCQCPLATQRFVREGARVINRKGETVTEGSETVEVGGVTSECDLVANLAGMVDHLYYAHGWSGEQIVEIVEWYENRRAEAGAMYADKILDFPHYQVAGHRVNGGAQ